MKPAFAGPALKKTGELAAATHEAGALNVQHARRILQQFLRRAYDLQIRGLRLPGLDDSPGTRPPVHNSHLAQDSQRFANRMATDEVLLRQPWFRRQRIAYTKVSRLDFSEQFFDNLPVEHSQVPWLTTRDWTIDSIHTAP
jgi:hypothetical protein